MSYQITSKFGKSLYHVLGMTDNIKQFDPNHTMFKSFRYDNSGQICQKKRNPLAKKVKEVYMASNVYLKKWERDFLAENMRQPQIEDMNQEMVVTHKRVIHGKSILKLWKIDF